MELNSKQFGLIYSALIEKLVKIREEGDKESEVQLMVVLTRIFPEAIIEGDYIYYIKNRTILAENTM